MWLAALTSPNIQERKQASINLNFYTGMRVEIHEQLTRVLNERLVPVPVKTVSHTQKLEARCYKNAIDPQQKPSYLPVLQGKHLQRSKLYCPEE